MAFEEIHGLLTRMQRRVITSPDVVLFADTRFRGHPRYPIPSDGDDSVKTCALAAKMAYDSFGADGRPNRENQRQCLDNHDGSVIEHAHYSVVVEGVSRALSLESNRHRAGWALTQRSTRFTGEDDAKIVLNPVLAGIWKRVIGRKPDDMLDVVATYELDALVLALSSFESACRDYGLIVKKYEQMWDERHDDGQDVPYTTAYQRDRRKWARGKARDLLPHSLETRIAYTANLRAWRWFIELRSDGRAEDEIRRLAHYVLQELRAFAPLYFEDFEQVGEKEGIPIWKPRLSKV